jgi:hypothetical protein
VTSGASGRRAGVFPADVARRARRGDVRPRQWELGVRVVIELGARPLHSRVTGLTRGWEYGGDVIGIGRLLVVTEVA